MPHRILIADDEPNIVASLEFLMRKCDYEVCVARDGDEALQLAEAFRPDLVLLDVMMPRRSGFEVCRLLRAHPALEQARRDTVRYVEEARAALAPLRECDAKTALMQLCDAVVHRAG